MGRPAYHSETLLQVGLEMLARPIQILPDYRFRAKDPFKAETQKTTFFLQRCGVLLQECYWIF